MGLAHTDTSVTACREGWNVKPQSLQPMPVRLLLFTIAAFLVQPFLLLAGAQTSTGGEQPHAIGQDNNPSYYDLASDASSIRVNVLVTDEDGTVLSNLKAGNFRILDNGTPRTIDSFAPTSAPITIALLMEYSAVSYGYFAGKASEWASTFLDHLEAKDWVALVTFDMNSQVRVDFTRRRFEVRDALNTMGAPQFSEANLYDGIVQTLDRIDSVKGRKAILLLATGLNSFSDSTFDDVRSRLQASDTVLFCVGLAEGEYVRSGGSDISYTLGKNSLTTFARQTGGIALFPRFAGELPSIFRSVVSFLRNEYTLTFRVPDESRDGKYHRLKIEVIGSDGTPLVVTNEKGRKRKVEAHARAGYMTPTGRSQSP